MSKEDFVRLEGLSTHYDQIRKVAIGGMAEVYVARQINLDRPVAIKRIKAELRKNPDIQERFKREAKASANLLHQNLAHVYDYREIASDSYIIMEWIDGFDLAEVLEKGPLPLDIACMIAQKVLMGLAHIHAHGMVHRDIKPDNIRLSARGEVKLMDFGIAFDPSEGHLTMPGIMIGSPHYLSPEQITGSRLDGRADLFSFGISFYEMLCGKKPFVETKEETVYTKIQKGRYTSIESLRSEVPPFLQKVVESCLHVHPSKRPASANRVASSLQEFILRHYSLSADARIKQFLIQSDFLPGAAELIEIEERTLDPSATPQETRSAAAVAAVAAPASSQASIGPVDYRHRQGIAPQTWLLALLFTLIFLAGGFLIYERHMEKQAVSIEPHIEGP